MAVRRMNELWKTMALAFMFGFLLLHGCQGQETTVATAPSLTATTAGGDTATDPVKSTAPVTAEHSTLVITAEKTIEPSKSSFPDTTDTTESNTSGNNKNAILTTSQPDQQVIFTTADVNALPPKILEPNNSASNQKSTPLETNEKNAKSGSSSTVFVSVLMSGLVLAGIIVGIYYFKCHRRTDGKGMKLAEESYMADEENQGNTLVSVAPLNQPEPQEKPSLNGESQEAVKPQSPPAATNGHSTTKTADTEL
ncbi:uncharacterized protein cd34 [Pseudorasbora parva]|uniref:uncharacterized protein cd34 n=1 Tax=Pseudorasbora parva TaxID=51549 RepID=UPI00351F024E